MFSFIVTAASWSVAHVQIINRLSLLTKIYAPLVLDSIFKTIHEVSLHLIASTDFIL